MCRILDSHTYPLYEILVEQAVTGVANSYEAEFQSLETKARELGKQADALGKNLGF